MTSEVCWGIRAGFLEEGASGAGFGLEAIPAEKRGMLCPSQPKLHGEGGPETRRLGTAALSWGVMERW